ncbi:hypothetical protein ACK8HX_08815 [Oryzobacter sp. R7]|uniref:hypothetical protein n=1 Tax=Oryzobacter faecalis TaxID=3388656 RepID=UPI00398D3FE3
MTGGREVAARRALVTLLLAAAAASGVPAASAAAAAACPADRPLVEVSVSTVPVVPGARLDVAGRTVVTDGAGHATVTVCRLTSARDITAPTTPIQLPGHRRAIFDRVFLSARGRVVQAAYGIDHEVSFAFSGLPTRQIERFSLKSSTGEVITRTDLGPVHLPGTRVLRGPDGLEEREIYYSVESVTVAGSSVVNRSQIRFYPSERQVVRVPLLAFDVRVEVVDRLFRHPVGSEVQLVREGILDLRKPLVDGQTVFTEVPRGEYDVVAAAPGLRINRSLTLSTDQVVVMPVLTWLDLAVLGGVPLAIAVGLVLAPRPRLRQRLVAAGRWPLVRGRRLAALALRGAGGG